MANQYQIVPNLLTNLVASFNPIRSKIYNRLRCQFPLIEKIRLTCY